MNSGQQELCRAALLAEGAGTGIVGTWTWPRRRGDWSPLSDPPQVIEPCTGWRARGCEEEYRLQSLVGVPDHHSLLSEGSRKWGRLYWDLDCARARQATEEGKHRHQCHTGGLTIVSVTSARPGAQ
ncbi:hypothetical protein NDU88_003759 [Pleurodeles waltl]|uniref:Uncharacterized protein n=1 Tax=Pleurodeles waltl TaxID=8319 RepID=A0AAV7UDE4_PLEWA|nr:hypothetical protein NDU88_003759 [Pleurodeles waltl]